MNREKFQYLITNITAVLHNYLNIAEYSGRVVLVVNAAKGEVSTVEVSNVVSLNLEGYKDGKDVPAFQSKPGS